MIDSSDPNSGTELLIRATYREATTGALHAIHVTREEATRLTAALMEMLRWRVDAFGAHPAPSTEKGYERL